MTEGQTSTEIAQKLLAEAVAYGDVEDVGETDDGETLYRRTA